MLKILTLIAFAAINFIATDKWCGFIFDNASLESVQLWLAIATPLVIMASLETIAFVHFFIEEAE